jgi:hypothetical protein
MPHVRYAAPPACKRRQFCAAGSVDSDREKRHDPLVNIPGVPSLRLTVRSSLYVVAVAMIAAVGLTEQSPWPILRPPCKPSRQALWRCLVTSLPARAEDLGQHLSVDRWLRGPSSHGAHL